MINAERVPVRPGSEKRSYYKYMSKEFAKIPEEKLELLKSPIMPMEDGLLIDERNKLFEPGYLSDEVGVYPTPDGGKLVTNRTFFPGSNGEMFQWWFAWHALDPLRYAIWDPYDHYGLEIFYEDRAKILDPEVSIPDKSRNVLHVVSESMIPGNPPDTCFIHFRDPAEMGYESEKIGTDACSFMVTANGMTYTPDGLIPAVMTHMTRDIEGGCELRSRFWMGYQIIKGKAVYCMPPGVEFPLQPALDLLEHNIFEYSNLAEVLPLVYAEEKDNWE